MTEEERITKQIERWGSTPHGLPEASGITLMRAFMALSVFACMQKLAMEGKRPIRPLESFPNPYLYYGPHDEQPEEFTAPKLPTPREEELLAAIRKHKEQFVDEPLEGETELWSVLEPDPTDVKEPCYICHDSGWFEQELDGVLCECRCPDGCPDANAVSRPSCGTEGGK